MAKLGHKVPFNLPLFVKCQLRIGGIFHERDPRLKGDKLIMEKCTGQVIKEPPKRFLYPVSATFPSSHTRLLDRSLDD